MKPSESTVVLGSRSRSLGRVLASSLIVLLGAASVSVPFSGLVSCAGPGLEISSVAPTDDPLVEIVSADPRIRVRTVYATADNFVGEVLYPVSRTFIRSSAMERLSRVQDRLEAQGLGLLVFDAYRPWSVTKRMWDVVGDPDFVADPSKGSRHNRGMAVDCALVNAEGRPLPMPTAFDAFVPEARSDAALAVPELAKNRDLLIEAMAAEGFRVLSSEWWHFDADGWETKGLLNVPLETLP